MLCSGSADGYPLTFYTAGILKWIFGVCQKIARGVPALKLQQPGYVVIAQFSTGLQLSQGSGHLRTLMMNTLIAPSTGFCGNETPFSLLMRQIKYARGKSD